MHNLAKKMEPVRPELEYGTVTESAGALVVDTSLGELRAVRAAGCLLRPEKGDTVLLSVDSSGGAWVLSVLQRSGAAPGTMELEGDSVLLVRGGSLTVAPEAGLDCVTGRATLQAQTAELGADSVSLSARLFSSQVELAKRVAGAVEEVSREFTRRAASYFRFTTGHEDRQAGSSRQLVEETMTIHSKNSLIVSEEQVKIDGELIHMG